MPNIFKRRDAGSKDKYKKGHKYVDGGEMRAEVVIVDLMDGTETVVATTASLGSSARGPSPVGRE